jgi:chromosomal replication initiation ATPase DnaA
VLLALDRPGPEETKTLLSERARATGFALPEDVRDAILARSATLATAVQQVDRWAVASRALGEPLAARWLEEVAPGLAATTREDVVRRAKDAVARHFAIDRGLLDRPTKARHAAFPRRVAIYLVYRACPLPLSDLGAAFGLRSHSSVSRAVNEMREARLQDPSLEQTLDGLLAAL